MLTASELAAVTAGRVILPPIQINLNNDDAGREGHRHLDRGLRGCTNATVTAFSNATAFNVNLAELTNLAF